MSAQDPSTVPVRTSGSHLRHDLRTPIHQIIGYAELIEEEADERGWASSVTELKEVVRCARELLERVDHGVQGDGPLPTGLWDAMVAPLDGIAAAARRLEVDLAPREQPRMLEDVKRIQSAAERFRTLAQQALGGRPASGPVPTPEAPKADEPASRPERSSGPVVTLEGGEQAQVLVVDDNEMNRDMLARRLRRQGYSAEIAEDGYRALALLKERSFDLILLDIMMPGLSGYDVLKDVRLTRSMSELPVIMATAKDQGEDIVEALKLGANDYVTKPLDFAVVLARVRTQLSLKRAMEEVRRLAEELERKNQFIRKTFGRYLSDDVVSGLLETPDGLALGGEQRTVTVLMSDLRGFSAVSERLAPEQVVRLLNRYLGAMADVITRFKGTIDEFIGDAVLALFGAPVTGSDDALRGVACAVEMQRAMAAVNAANRQDGLPAIQMGIAVNTGEVIVGNIGSETRAKYGVVGSPVNLTARIESATLGGQVFVSETTLTAAGAALEVGGRMTMDVKGFSEPIAFYEVHAVGAPFDVSLPERPKALRELRAPITVRFSALEGKHVSGSGHTGQVVRLGTGVVEVCGEEIPVALTNLRMHLVDGQGLDVPGDVYAKVLADDVGTGAFLVGLTSLSPEGETFLAAAALR